MSDYRLTQDALDDLATILDRAERRAGLEARARIEHWLFAAFDRIAANPGIGHLRSDLIERAVWFHYADPCLVIFRRDSDPVGILAILHGARDVSALLVERRIE